MFSTCTSAQLRASLLLSSTYGEHPELSLSNQMLTLSAIEWGQQVLIKPANNCPGPKLL